MRVVWAIDGGEAAQAAGRLLAGILDVASTELVALTVVPADPLPWLEAPVLGTGHRVDRERQEELQAALREGIAATGWPADRVERRIESGDPARTIVEVATASRADLLVLGARGRPHSGELIGPTCAEVLIHAPCPVLIVRNDDPWRTVLLATDGSETAQAAEVAVSALRVGEAAVVALAVAAKAPLDVQPADAPLSEELRAAAIAEEAAARLRTAGVSAEALAATGRPADVIHEQTARLGAQLVVLGTHGRTGWRRAVLGSVAGEVARTSTASVLIVPPPSRG